MQFDNYLPEITESDYLAITDEIKNYLLVNNRTNNGSKARVNNTLNSATSSSSAESSTSSSSASANQLNPIEPSSPPIATNQNIISPNGDKEEKKEDSQIYESIIIELNPSEKSVQNKEDTELKVLDAVTNFLKVKTNENPDDENNENEIQILPQGNSQFNKEASSASAAKLEDFVSHIAKEIKVKLEEAKQLVITNKNEFDQQVSHLIKIQKEVENRLLVDDNFKTITETAKTNKKNLYSNLLVIVENLLKNSVSEFYYIFKKAFLKLFL